MPNPKINLGAYQGAVDDAIVISFILFFNTEMISCRLKDTYKLRMSTVYIPPSI